MFGLALFFVYVFLLSFWYFDHLAWGRGSWSLCLSCICLLSVYTLSVSPFLFLQMSGLAAASACGYSWTFLFTFLYLNHSGHVHNKHTISKQRVLGLPKLIVLFTFYI